MMTPATHSGHCQACGRLQKLPNGVLAKHGYKIMGGFFAGVCVGSGHAPFEESYSLLPGFIASAEKELGRLVRVQDSWKANTSPNVMVHNFEGKGYTFGNHSVWRKVTLEFEERTYGEGEGLAGWTSFKAFYIAPGPSLGGWSTARKEDVRHEVSLYGSNRTTAEIIEECNNRYIRAVQPAVDDMHRYIAWQQNRIKTWVRRELIPVTVKPVMKEERKVEFKPDVTEAFA